MLKGCFSGFKINSGYTGGTVYIGTDYRTVPVPVIVTGTGVGRTISATAISGDITKTVLVTASLQQNTGLMVSGRTIDAWQEVDPYVSLRAVRKMW